jgi:parallel beta-helix repeat protein
MKRKCLAVGIILLFVGTCIIPAIAKNTEKQSSRGSWLYVGGSGPGNYTRIQDAIDNASDGDTVFVYSGIYLENLNIAKDGIELVGENKYTTILDGNKKDDVIRISGNYTYIKEFTIQNSSNMHVGIAVQILMYPPCNIKNIHISNCIFKNNDLGVLFNNVSQCSLSNCQFYNLTAQSVTIRLSSEDISITNCSIHDSGEEVGGGWISSGNINVDGRTLDEDNRYNCSNITICNNDIYNLLGNGITIIESKNVHIYQNNIYKNSFNGIEIVASSDCQICHNNIYENSINGIFIERADVKIFNNSIYKNGVGRYYDGGILLQDCFNNITVNSNVIKENNQYGLLLIRSSMNSITKNNFINNTFNAYFMQHSLLNHWRENYWTDYFGLRLKIIKGTLGLSWFPWMNFDLHPAQEPYDIPGMS